MAGAISYFDCDALIGRPKAPLAYVEPSVDDMLAEMRRLGVGRALVRHRACDEAGAPRKEGGRDVALSGRIRWVGRHANYAPARIEAPPMGE